MANRALVFGIDAYAPPTRQLTSAVLDAVRVAKWLVTRSLVAPADLYLGIAPLPGDETLPPALAGCTVFKPVADEALVQIDAAVAGGPYERVYFFFAGHGVASENEMFPQQDALCFQDYTPTTAQKALTVGSIATALKGMDAPERFLIIDACRNPAIAPNRPIGATPSYPPKRRGSGLFVINASPPGERAVSIVNGGGLLTTAFVQSVDKGQGSAKRWDEGRGEYVVPWSRLTAAIGEQVAERQDQIVFTSNDAPATADPILITFTEAECPPAKLSLSFTPATMRTRAKLSIRRDGTFDDISEECDILAGTCEVVLKQSEYLVKVSPATTPGDFQSAPALLSVKVFDAPAATGAFTLDPLSPVAPVPDAGTVPESTQPGTGAVESRGFATDAAIGPAVEADRDEGKPGKLALTVGGEQVDAADPWLSVSLTTVGGEPLPWDRATPDQLLRPGAYALTVSTPDGKTSKDQAIVEPNRLTTIDLARPADRSEDLEKALMVAKSEAYGTLMPSEMLGPISGVTFSALGSLSVVQALTGYDGRARALGLGDAWSGGPPGASGVHLLIADERDGQPAMKPERLRIWRMYEDTTARSGETRQPDRALRYAEVGIAAPAGGSWAELRDSDRQRRAGFKLATQVASRAVTLVVVSRERSGTTGLFQFVLERARGTEALLKSVFFGEALQRARNAAKPLAEDSALQTLLADQWFEPCSAAVAAFALYDAGEDYDEAFRLLSRRLMERAAWLPDATVAQALGQELDGQEKVARMIYQAALSRLDAPVSGLATAYLKEAAIRHRLFGPGRRYITEKSDQMIPHPLWLVRREDDVKPSRAPMLGG